MPAKSGLPISSQTKCPTTLVERDARQLEDDNGSIVNRDCHLSSSHLKGTSELLLKHASGQWDWLMTRGIGGESRHCDNIQPVSVAPTATLKSDDESQNKNKEVDVG